MITFIWMIAITSITFKSIFFDNFPEWFGLLIYISLGWIGVLSAIQLWKNYGLEMIKPLFYGGIAYSAGAVIDFMQYPILIDGVIGPHEIFHFAVLAGISYHWKFIHQAFFNTRYSHAFDRMAPAQTRL